MGAFGAAAFNPFPELGADKKLMMVYLKPDRPDNWLNNWPDNFPFLCCSPRSNLGLLLQ